MQVKKANQALFWWLSLAVGCAYNEQVFAVWGNTSGGSAGIWN